ncbi:OB-fold nucleic acid binding domain-containing protein [Nanoarchaeota archaeon]
MADQQFKRNIAFKLRIGDILMGKPVMDGERFSFLDWADKKVVRVNVVGNVVDKHAVEGEKKYVFYTIDDGSGQIGLRVFSDDFERFKDFNQGETVLVIGLLRQFNNQIYITPEIIKVQDPKYLLVRKLETEKEKSKKADPLGRDQIVAVKDKILRAIKVSEDDGGVEMDKLIMQLNDISPTIINQEVEKFIAEGIVFEPRPGKVRYLG